MKKINIKTIISGVLLLIATFGVVFLANQNQDNRNKAAGSSNYIKLNSQNSGTKTVSGDFTVPITAGVTAGGADSVVIYFCYNPSQIKLNDDTNLQDDFSFSDPTSFISALVKVDTPTNKCISATFVSAQKNTKLPVSTLAEIKFTTKANSGGGQITVDQANSLVGVAGGKSVNPASVGNFGYTIGAGENSSTTGSYINLNSAESETGQLKTNQEFIVPITAGVTAGGVDSAVTYFCYNSKQVELKDPAFRDDFAKGSTLFTGASVKTNTSTTSTNDKCISITFFSVQKNEKLPVLTFAEIKFITKDNPGKGQIAVDQAKSSVGVAGRKAVNPASVGNFYYTIGTENNPPSGGTSKLNFKFTLAGIRPNATCLSSLDKLAVAVEVANVPTTNYQGDLTIPFTSISRTEEVDSKGNQIFEVKSLVLDNSKFSGVDNLNYIKIKGPFHLKGRMCKDGQTAKIAESVSCNIDLTTTDNYVYDFSKYALFSGDIKLDGAINSIDFSILKTNMAMYGDKVECGQEGDLDLNGKLNSLDASLLKESLLSRDDE